MVSGGGTGGHVYPILAVLEQLASENSAAPEAFYVGDASALEAELAAREGLPFCAIATASVTGASLLSMPSRLIRVAMGTAQAARLIDNLSPQVVMATGGYVCAPVVLGAWLRGVPSLVYLPDLAPGLAIRVLSRFATRLAVSFPASGRHFAPGKAVITGYPVRAELFQADKLASRERLQLDPGEKTLLIFGGSQGAHSINAAASEILAELLEICQVVHITGTQDETWLKAQRDQLPQSLARRYRVYGYLHEEMIDALAAADLAVARSGAATTAEFPALGLPSILIPYPYAGQHQQLNAEYMVEHGAAIKISDADVRGEVLLRNVARLFDDQQTLQTLGDAAARLARPDAARRVVDVLREIARPNYSVGHA